MKPGRVAVLVIGLLAIGAGSWALYYSGALSETVSLRLGGGLAVGLVFVLVLPIVWPARPGPSPLEEALRPRTGELEERPRSLRQIDIAVRLAVTREGGYELHYRLCPVLRELAAYRLRRHFVEMSASPDAARRILGEELWQLVREDRPPPDERNSRGIPPGELASVIDRLESL